VDTLQAEALRGVTALRNATVRSHRGLYGVSPHLRIPECARLAEFVGIVMCRDVKEKVALWSCPCGSLIALHRHCVLWEVETPPAALPIAATVGGA
jgi:hypothetical protein